ncbi:MAG: VCBS repeat-containing protein [Ferruginibacter sp.]
MKNCKLLFCCYLVLGWLVSCRDQDHLFKKISPAQSGILFNNEIRESDSFNIIDKENLYNGGGVGIGDFNNDGLQDIFFTGNMVSCKLYLNKGKMQFQDVTSTAGVDGMGRWARGVAVVDINNDGLLDIYVSNTFLDDSASRSNILYINQGNDSNGVPKFLDKAGEYNLDSRSYTTQSAFFDYDNDGDLDVFCATNVFVANENASAFRRKWVNGEHPSTDLLLRNDWDSALGHPVFTDVSREAGIRYEGFSHGVVICDINTDGWKDIFVTNDYLSENLLYINNGNGTFTNDCRSYFKHTALNAMGADVIDINNDGLSDVVELDMNPEDNFRKKTMMRGGNYQYYINADYYDYQYQYIRNCIHLNRGALQQEGRRPNPVFSDISFMTQLSETDWSWTPLVADFDNDGFRDVLITNGFPRDVTDLDFMAYRNTAFAMNDKQKLVSKIPSVKISNYVFQNKHDLSFADVTDSWGLNDISYSNGAATADLDNDGDLDVVINNINDYAFVYENTSRSRDAQKNNYLHITLEGLPGNKDAFGSIVTVYYDHGKLQRYETNPVRGYLSSIENAIFFGLGSNKVIDSLIVQWPDNTYQKLIDMPANRQISLRQSEASGAVVKNNMANDAAWFKDISEVLPAGIKDSVYDFNDFSIQPLLPHKLDGSGPAVAAGDVNADGIDDLLIGKTSGGTIDICVQGPDGKFKIQQVISDSLETHMQVRALELLDIDKDGDLDLYVAVGGYYQAAGSKDYADKLYINDGKGNFKYAVNALPALQVNVACIRSCDFDKDGDIDIFIGSRCKPREYPAPVSGYILRNDIKNGIPQFTDITNQVAPSLVNMGLICDGQWVDIDKDGWADLVIAGEWMPITILKNDKGRFIKKENTGLENKKGWWNTLAVFDVDNDGDMDLVAGNLGLNSFFGNSLHPVKAYYNDFDNNGTKEVILTKYFRDRKGDYNEYTIHSRDEVLEQLPFIKKKFLLYTDFAKAGMNQLFGEQLVKAAVQLEANYFESSIIRNNGNGNFQMIPLAALAQIAPVNSIIVRDFNGDNQPDIFLAGNDYGSEVSNGRLDASYGLLLKGTGKGDFVPVALNDCGIVLPGQVNSMKLFRTAKKATAMIALQRGGPAKIYEELVPLTNKKNSK